jgi:outer membrane protein assembly factor BamB
VSGGRVVALSLDTKVERWRHERPKVASISVGRPTTNHVFTDAGDPVGSGIAVANGVVFFTAITSGKLIALDAATGEVLKEIALGPVWSGPSVSRGRVYVGTGNTQFLPPQKDTGVLSSFGLPGEDEVSRLGAGRE